MYGPVEVRKSAVAKSCAKEAAEYQTQRLVLISRSETHNIDDPTRFFTTIAHQLIAEIGECRQVIDPRIQHNRTLLSKGLDIQFHELIALFLELAGQNVRVRGKIVIIDGLDECIGNSA